MNAIPTDVAELKKLLLAARRELSEMIPKDAKALLDAFERIKKAFECVDHGENTEDAIDQCQRALVDLDEIESRHTVPNTTLSPQKAKQLTDIQNKIADALMLFEAR